MIERVAIVGGGVIGAGWAARLAMNGIGTVIYDPDSEAPRKVAETMQNAAAACAKLTAAPRPPFAAPSFAGSVSAAVSDAEWIIESVPERAELKQKVYAEIEKTADKRAIISSSTSGFRPGMLQKNMKYPERFLVAHPFNPVYLLPLVEVVRGGGTASRTAERVCEILSALGMRPLHIKKEIDAFVADRLMEAAWREALWLVKDGVATTADVDDAIRFGFGLRWAQMGAFETFRIAGGEGGITHFLRQFGPCLKLPWTKLTDVPELTEEFADKIAAQSDAQSGRYSVRELERIRDDNLIAFLHVLKANRWGAGETLAAWENRLQTRAPSPDISLPLRTLSRRAPRHWTDYNGHINESRYLECFSDASDSVLRLIGAGGGYVVAGNSYFTVETHIRNIGEARAGDMIYGDSTVLLAEGKKIKLFHELRGEDGGAFATGEHLLIHVDLNTRRSSLPSEEVLNAAAAIAAAHAKLPPPEGAGRI
ncbi:MAG: carnitine 3-dehydrogenase [Gammaproteobacteria bacterium]